MKAAFYLAVICGMLFLFQKSSPLFAQTENLKDIEQKIKDLENDKKNMEALISVMNETKSKIVNEKMFIIPGTFSMVTKKMLDSWVMTLLLNGTIKLEEVPDYVKKTEKSTEVAIEVFTGTINECESALKKIKDEISYYLDEKIRLKGLADCIPKVTGMYIINGDPTGYMMLTQNGSHVEGFYGGDKNGLVNSIKGDFKCDELSGTFENTEYKITGTFKYKFAKDGSSYTGTWKNDVGGATGSNSGRKE